jgi:hypothetical protein
MRVRAGFALGLIAVISALAFGVALADSNSGLGVTITTPPIAGAEKVYYNPGTLPSTWHFIGTYPRYGAKYLEFTWKPYPFAATVHGAYRVALMQNTTPLAALPTWTPSMISDVWADNPAGPGFSMGPFLRGYGLCDACPSKIVVSAETYQAVQTPGTQDWQIVYTPILTVPTNPPVYGAAARRVQESNTFVIQTASQTRCDQSSGPDC